MRVLVVYGSKRGGTEGLARVVAEGLTAAGHTVEVLPAGKQFDSLERWDAVVVGGALYMFFWHRDARRFVRRHLEELQQMPVWFFSSGPLDDSARGHEVPPTAPVARLAKLSGAQGHITFGGRLLPDAKTALASRGDFRDLPTARAWGQDVGEQLDAMVLRERAHVPAAMSVVHQLVLWLCLFTGLTAVAGGITLLSSPRDVAGLLEHSPFDSFVLPGLLLLLVVGVGNLAAAGMEARRFERSELAVLGAGATLTGWIVIQLAMIRTVSFLQLIYFLIGAVTFGASIWLWRVRHRLAPHRLSRPF